MAWQLSHVVNNSWLPLSMSFLSFLMMMSLVFSFKYGFNLIMLMILMISTSLLFFVWMRDVIRESLFQGHHTFLVQSGLKWGMIWFIFGEVWFFFSIFWTFFHMSVSPMNSSMIFWPFIGLEPIPAFQVPLLNTVILLMSGVTATLAHHKILKGEQTLFIFISGILGAYFLSLQAMEYYYSMFSFQSGVIGSVFFFSTGFHGLHVCLGMIMLMSVHLRLSNSSINSYHHFSLEFSLWYWHFVDVVWLFLFSFVYVWGT